MTASCVVYVFIDSPGYGIDAIEYSERGENRCAFSDADEFPCGISFGSVPRSQSKPTSPPDEPPDTGRDRCAGEGGEKRLLDPFPVDAA